MKVLLLFILGSAVFSAQPQSKESFQGEITYRYSEFPTGDFPMLLEKVSIGSDYFYQEALQMKYGIVLNDLYCDLKNKKRYEIDHKQKTIVDLGTDPAASIELLDLQYLKDSTLNGEPCSVVQFLRNHTGKNGDEKVVYTYFLSKQKEIANIEILAALQANSNTKILDGRFKGVPMLITMAYERGKILTIEATEIKEGDFQPLQRFRNYKK